MNSLPSVIHILTLQCHSRRSPWPALQTIREPSKTAIARGPLCPLKALEIDGQQTRGSLHLHSRLFSITWGNVQSWSTYPRLFRKPACNSLLFYSCHFFPLLGRSRWELLPDEASGVRRREVRAPREAARDQNLAINAQQTGINVWWYRKLE